MVRPKLFGGRPSVSMEFPSDLESPGRVRSLLRRLLGGAEDPIAEDVELAASELVSNVVQHTEDGGWVRAWDPKPDVPFLLEVEDTSPQLDASSSGTEYGGHGLGIVENVADEWGVDRYENGKTVWAVFDRSKRPQE